MIALCASSLRVSTLSTLILFSVLLITATGSSTTSPAVTSRGILGSTSNIIHRYSAGERGREREIRVGSNTRTENRAFRSWIWNGRCSDRDSGDGEEGGGRKRETRGDTEGLAGIENKLILAQRTGVHSYAINHHDERGNTVVQIETQFCFSNRSGLYKIKLILCVHKK